jgi:hypothetical protein
MLAFLFHFYLLVKKRTREMFDRSWKRLMAKVQPSNESKLVRILTSFRSPKDNHDLQTDQ